MELFKLLGTFAIQGADSAKREINEVTDTAESKSNKLNSIINGIGNTAMAMGAVVASAGVAVGTAIVGITKTATGAYAEYEQLVGGIKTLYGDDFQKVLDNAQQAYHTAGKSANDYMETVISYSGALLQALNNDTAESARIADMAISDMADNVNKLGTNVEMVEHAYRGFSRFNFTMLDNLALGYAGTKEEMQRLLDDANAINAEAGIITDYQIDNLADIYNAIHVIQTEMGITGTTVQEAGDTITGSMSAVKASWENIMIALRGDRETLNASIKIFVDNIMVMASNMLPTIKAILMNIPNLIKGLGTPLYEKARELLANLSTSIEQNLPIVVDKAKTLMSNFGNKIKENMPEVLSKALDMLLGFSETIYNNLPTLVLSGMEFIKSIVQGIVASFPTLIAQAPQIIINIANAISNSMMAIWQKGVEIVWEIIKGIFSAIPDLMANFPKVIEAIFAVWQAVNWLNLGTNLMNGIKDGIKNMSGSLKDTAVNTFNALKTRCVEIFNAFKNGVLAPMTAMRAMIGESLLIIKNAFVTQFSAVKTSVTTIFNAIKYAIVNPIENAKSSIKTILDTIKGFFSGFKISIPKIPLPHFSLRPSDWSIGDLLKGSIPSLGISWYKKAMDDGMILDSPTIFGYKDGQLLGGGEAGSETVVGTQSLMNMINEAVKKSNDKVDNTLNEILRVLNMYLSLIYGKNMQLVLDNGVLVGELINDIDMQLGDIALLKERGVR